MKVYLKKPANFSISLLDVCEKMVFWQTGEKKEKTAEVIYEFLKSLGLQEIIWWFNAQDWRIRDIVKIDKYDAWNLDNTLAKIIVPALKQLRTSTHGYPNDINSEPLLPEGLKDEHAWDWCLGEMIWAFEQSTIDWTEQYESGEVDFIWTPVVDPSTGKSRYSNLSAGPNHTFKMDIEGQKKHAERMVRGTTLFGKYYQNLWD
jgi:hypothetical protein